MQAWASFLPCAQNGAFNPCHRVMSQQLTAVNRMLTSVGQAPILNLDQANPEIATATLILSTTRKEVLGEGWDFNSEKGYTLVADSNGDIFVPEGVLNLSVNQEDTQYRFRAIQRDGRLYDKLSHSFNWTAGTTVSCDVVWDIGFEDLPQVFQAYVTQRAARVFAGRTIGSEKMVAFNSQDEQLLRANCLAYDCTTGRHNALTQYYKGRYTRIPTPVTLNVLAR